MTEVYATPQTQTAARPGGAAPSLGARPILSVRQIEKVYGNRDSVTAGPSTTSSSSDVAPGEFVCASMGAVGLRQGPTLLNCHGGRHTNDSRDERATSLGRTGATSRACAPVALA